MSLAAQPVLTLQARSTVQLLCSILNGFEAFWKT